MKKIRITETELVNLIEKLVKENFAQGAANGNGQNFGLFGILPFFFSQKY